MSNPPVLRPYINLATLALVIPDRGHLFTGEEWRNMAMPPCPKCGETIEADRVEVTPMGEKVRTYIFGRWECPNECDPR